MAGAAARAGPRQATGLIIKGLAGPHVVEVQGFAPGTTAADVEQATKSQGIAVYSCRLVRTSPTVDADVVCETKEDAEQVHGVFHNKEVGFVGLFGRLYGGDSLNFYRRTTILGLASAIH